MFRAYLLLVALVLAGCEIVHHGGPGYSSPYGEQPTYVQPPTYVEPAPVVPVQPLPPGYGHGSGHGPGHGHGSDHAYSPFTPEAPRTGGGSLSIAHWDVGGGQWIRPWARIEVDVRGPASKIGLYAVDGSGVHQELELRDARNQQRIRFDQRYGRLGTDSLAILLYDSRGRIIAFLRRSPTR